jgi:hypothetical protein
LGIRSVRSRQTRLGSTSWVTVLSARGLRCSSVFHPFWCRAALVRWRVDRFHR